MSVHNDTYIFDLDDPKIKEINFIYRLDQLNEPEKFVNTGATHYNVIMMRNEKKFVTPKTARLHKNEQVSLLFWETRIPFLNYKDQ